MTELIVSALRRARPGIVCVAADGPAEALRRAILMAAGDAVLFLYEKLSAAQDAFGALGAEPGAADAVACGAGRGGDPPGPPLPPARAGRRGRHGLRGASRGGDPPGPP